MGLRGIVALLALCGVAAGCASSATSSTARRPSAIVALGDSVPRGTNCNCTPFPPLTATDLATRTGQKVTATNDSLAGATTTTVLNQLKSNGGIIKHVRASDVVEIEIGANDVGYSSSCGVEVSCYTKRVPDVRKNLDAIVKRVRKLDAGHRSLVVLLDYWSVWLGGKYAAAKGEAYVDAAAKVTDSIDDLIKATAIKTGSAYVDLRAAFKGPNYAYDETHYLSNDGDHPNAAGHKQIAAAAESVIERRLHL